MANRSGRTKSHINLLQCHYLDQLLFYLVNAVALFLHPSSIKPTTNSFHKISFSSRSWNNGFNYQHEVLAQKPKISDLPRLSNYPSLAFYIPVIFPSFIHPFIQPHPVFLQTSWDHNTLVSVDRHAPIFFLNNFLKLKTSFPLLL